MLLPKTVIALELLPAVLYTYAIKVGHVVCGTLAAQVPPVVTHAKLGTLYEEPCIVYIKVC